ncbi:MAG TPA: hypothetical protein ENJ33_03315 [Thiothrix sp.]|nr:hypothetical protein [Thiothrix sp.]
MLFYSRYFHFTLALMALFFPNIALAHSPIKGMGDFLNGVLHPLLVPSQVLLIVALGLWYGQHQPNQHKKSVLLFLLATIVGLLITGLFPVINTIGNNTLFLLLLMMSISIGMIIVTGVSIPPPVFILLGLLSGFLLGLDSSPDQLVMKEKIASLFGSGIGIYFLMLYAMALSESLSTKPWQTIAVRVIASWLSASAFMVLALHFSLNKW